MTNEHDSSLNDSKLLRRLHRDEVTEPEPEPAPSTYEQQPVETVSPFSYEEPQPPAEHVDPFTLEDVVRAEKPTTTGQLVETGQMRADEALRLIDEKIQSITMEYASGKINQQQFQSVFTHYREQKEIISRMIEKDPESEAWKNAATQGFTNILRKQHGAKAVGAVILDNSTGALIKKLGGFDVGAEILMSILSSFNIGSVGKRVEEPVMTQIEEGRYLALVQGIITSSVILFSTEPPADQQQELTRVHQEFEFANGQALEQTQIDPESLVYPHEELLA